LADQSRAIRLVVLDWAGTTVDFGCFAPVAPFVDSLAAQGVAVTPDQVRGPMGLNKIDHLRDLLRLPETAAGWREAQGRDWDESDVERVYRDAYLLALLGSVGRHCQVVPGLLDVIDSLRTCGIKIAMTTGYSREAATIVFEAARRQGYDPDRNVLPDEVPRGRPEPWMIRRAMSFLDVDSPHEVVKVGDTPADIAEGLNAGVWSVGVIAGGSEVGLTQADWAALPDLERRRRSDLVRRRFNELGAHAVIETLAELTRLIRVIEDRLRSGSDPEPIECGRQSTESRIDDGPLR